MDTRGKARRGTDYHSSDGPRNQDFGISLLQMQKQGSQNRLQMKAKKNSQDFGAKMQQNKEANNLNFSFLDSKGNLNQEASNAQTPAKKTKGKGYIFLRKSKNK